ncbi:hypothetical protein BBP40_012654 [Aspergillus hancockii]|nr:hypothetical protein BBP40_012654 [Aspergillus hancockii]
MSTLSAPSTEQEVSKLNSNTLVPTFPNATRHNLSTPPEPSVNQSPLMRGTLSS